MARFVFEHETLLEQRRRAERARRLVVAEAQRERMALEAMLRSAEASISSCRRDLRDALHGKEGCVNFGAVRMQAAASFGMTTRAQGVAIRLAGTIQRLERARGELLEASAARRAVELLKERRRAEWEREQSRRESAALDEIAVMAAARRTEALR